MESGLYYSMDFEDLQTVSETQIAGPVQDIPPHWPYLICWAREVHARAAIKIREVIFSDFDIEE